jgi:type IV pilus assembly protein PilC
MGTFSYTVRNKEQKILNGNVEGSTKEEVAKTLLDQGLTPVTITETTKPSILVLLARISNIPTAEKVLFSQELSTLVSAGVPISQSLGILEKQTKNKRFKNVISDLSKDVDGGLTLSGALTKHPKVFSSLFISMVKSGEIGGTLDESLIRLAEQMNKDRELTSKIKGAMIYPTVIFVAMVGALIFMLVTIVPKLQNMFEELGGELPATTKSLLFVSSLFTKYGLITAGTAICIYFTFTYLKRTVIPFRHFLHKLLLKVPVIGTLSTKINVARITRTLGSLLSSGVGVVEALDIVGDSTDNLLFKEAVRKASEKVKNGSTIAETLKNFKVFPILVPQMIAVGEETGSLDIILKKVADFYDSEVENITRNLTTLLEPLIMIVIGLMVGYVIVAIITPIYSMTNMI